MFAFKGSQGQLSLGYQHKGHIWNCHRLGYGDLHIWIKYFFHPVYPYEWLLDKTWYAWNYMQMNLPSWWWSSNQTWKITTCWSKLFVLCNLKIKTDVFISFLSPWYCFFNNIEIDGNNLLFYEPSYNLRAYSLFLHSQLICLPPQLPFHYTAKYFRIYILFFIVNADQFL